MALSVVTNIASVNAVRQFNQASADVNTSMQRLTTGLRINSAKDDAAGMQISNRFTSQINGLNIAQRNANDGISIAQTAEGSMQESSTILLRMRDLSLQSANAVNNLQDRDALQKEIQALQQQLTFIAETTKFGNHNLLDGSNGTKKIQIGSNANETVNITLRNMAADTIGAHQVNGEPTHPNVFTLPSPPLRQLPESAAREFYHVIVYYSALVVAFILFYLYLHGNWTRENLRAKYEMWMTENLRVIFIGLSCMNTPHMLLVESLNQPVGRIQRLLKRVLFSLGKPGRP